MILSTSFSLSPCDNVLYFRKKKWCTDKIFSCVLYVALNRKHYPEPQFPYLWYMWIIKTSLSILMYNNSYYYYSEMVS